MLGDQIDGNAILIDIDIGIGFALVDERFQYLMPRAVRGISYPAMGMTTLHCK